MDVQVAVWGLVEDAGVALHGPLVQAESDLGERVQVQPRLPQHQAQHLCRQSQIKTNQTLVVTKEVVLECMGARSCISCSCCVTEAGGVHVR